MEKSGKTDGWSDGWHTHASTGDSLCVLRDSVVGAAKSAVKTASTDGTNDKGKPDGWSDDWHANASPRESLGALRDSAVKTTTTREGWLKIARGAGTAAAATAAVGFVVLRNALRESHYEEEEQEDSEDGWRDGYEGFGYYYGGFRVDDED